MTKAHPGRVFIAIAVLALACVAASSASALDAFWRGELGRSWGDGIEPIDGKSNWYSHPRSGHATEVPDVKAVFTRHADVFDVLIEDFAPIKTMVIQETAPRYRFELKHGAALVLSGGGLLNASPRGVRFLLDGNMSLTNAARLSSAGSMDISVLPESSLSFNATSRGGNASVVNRGQLLFNQFAKADQMIIESGVGALVDLKALVRFADRADPGHAQITNRANGLVTFMTTGPLADGKITAGNIINEGNMIVVGETKLTISDNFVQSSQGRLFVEFDNGIVNEIVVRGSAQLAGAIDVHAPSQPPAGSYRLLRAVGGRTGMFTLASNIGKSSLRHTSNAVFLVVEP